MYKKNKTHPSLTLVLRSASSKEKISIANSSDEEYTPPVTRSQTKKQKTSEFEIKYNKTNLNIKKETTVNTEEKIIRKIKWTRQQAKTASLAMAVKKHELVQDPRQLDLTVLANYLQLVETHVHYLSSSELIKNCQDIVKCLARTHGSQSVLWPDLQVVEEFLVQVVNSVDEDVRQDIITAILEKFSQYISDPQTNAGAATSVVLVVLNSDTEVAQSNARWIVQRDEEAGGAGIRASLACLYTWLCQWNATSSLGDWVMAFIKVLEENERFDILIEVSIDNLGNLFSTMDDPGALRQSSADVIFHVLSSLRETKEALDVVTPHVGRVLTNLASDSGQFSRQLLQNLVDILTEMVDDIASIKKDTVAFKNKYMDVIICLERHMASGGCTFLQLPPWVPRSVCVNPIKTCRPLRKVGLHNLGNTCYVNSVIQALLLTRQFSTHVMMKMYAVPYWARMAMLFAKMMHSITNKVDPTEFFQVAKPPYFSDNHQHDSSEFLGYLFELLRTFEHRSDVNFDYSITPILDTRPYHAQRCRSVASQSSSTTVSEVDSEPVSPRPGGSGSGSGSNKRTKTNKEDHALPPKKRLRAMETSLRRDSFIDNLFGGVLLTRVECSECKTSSLSRDAFRDLQLAYPEEPEEKQFTVQTLIEYYCSEETLTGENKFLCNECECLRNAQRTVLIETIPKYLIIVLKNFKFEQKLQVQTKLMHQTYHNYKISLPTVRSQAVHATYVLYGAVVHTGTTLDSGHYYTLAQDNDVWFCYNDEEVKDTTDAELRGPSCYCGSSTGRRRRWLPFEPPLDEAAEQETAVNKLNRCCTPYILFYRRTDIEEGSALSLEDLPQKLQEHVNSHNKEVVDGARMQRRLGRP